MKSKSNSTPKPERALPAAKWVPILEAAGLALSVLGDAKTPHARAIKLGQWLSAKVGREMPVCVGGRNGKAVLRVIGARANEKRYYFEVILESAPQPEPAPAHKAKTPKLKKKAKQNEKHKIASKPTGKHKHNVGGDEERW